MRDHLPANKTHMFKLLEGKKKTSRRLIKPAIIFSLLAFSTQSIAQTSLTDTTTQRFSARNFRTWTVGVNAGVMSQHTLLWANNNNDYTTPTLDFGYSAYVRKQIIPSLGIRADFMFGKLRGFRAQSPAMGNETPYDIQFGTSYSTRIKWSGALAVDYSFANFKMWDEFGLFRPYVTAGVGKMVYDPTNVNSGNTTERILDSYFLPTGLGLRFGIARGINVDLGYKINFMKTDRLDGYDIGKTYDSFSYSHLGLEFAIGNRNKYQLAAYNPQSSKYDDSELRRRIAILDSMQREDRARYNRELGDEDDDGVANKFDKCPLTPAGVRVDGAGCPLPEFAQKVLNDAYNNLEFDFAKATIRSSSYPTLDKLATLLKENNWSLKLSGHTDNVGSERYNFGLSKDRAEAVKAYLVSKGANPSRIEATGYGELQPIASNETDPGRQRNRRVEFALY
ncbi:OmpA family protein [Pedobacter sp. SYSU D00535]|uniref:OmpA family protein n=1 Tax=Pedobacter sp. SYSU D00535 TaxID=2810308 RepID=UPI001F6009ED|nr:OmpA family protein [Pedobacter sp. SYSU D00535]